MSILKLQTNLPTVTQAPWVIKPADFNSIPKKPGVYILGIKSHNQFKNTFYPLYIGQTGKNSQSLHTRLKKHYEERSGVNSKSTKEIFDLSQINLNYSSLYKAIEVYNKLWIFNNKDGGSNKKHNLYFDKDIQDFLIYFQCTSFLNYNLNVLIKNCCWFDINHNKYFSEYLSKAKSGILKNFSNKYLKTKKSYEDFFYYAYIEMPESTDAQRETIEAELKFCLEKKLNIFTTSAVSGAGLNVWSSLLTGSHSSNNFDLSAIQNDLVNLGNHNYGNPFNNLLI